LFFQRVDLDDKPLIKSQPEHVILDAELPRCTTIGVNDARIHTIEHLMSALWGCGISNVLIEIDSIEIPGLDGSSIEFLKKIKSSGIEEQEKDAQVHRISKPLGVQVGGCSIFVVPAEELRISYLLNYTHPMLSSQFIEITPNHKNYETDIAPARTFCLETEAQQLQDKGLGKGANYENTLVIGDKGVINNELRFEDEFARHKVLDFIGDLYLLGKPFVGHVFATKSGHYLNLQLLRQIAAQTKVYSIERDVATAAIKGKKDFNVEEIMKVLPHRYPFLLVDHVTILEEGKKAIGIKNVIGNEDFFQGHFPTKPIMPGVLMVEAMAQTAGVVVLTNPAHHGKLAFFMATDKVKFRKVVSPGDQLRMEIEVVRDRSKMTQVEAKGYVGDQLVVEADMTFSFTDGAYLDE